MHYAVIDYDVIYVRLSDF